MKASFNLVTALKSDAKRIKLTPTSLSGDILHSEIIGKKTRDSVRSSRGADLRVYFPTLAEYVTMTPRIVTPVGWIHCTHYVSGSSLSSVDLSCRCESYSLITGYPRQSLALTPRSPMVRGSRSRHGARSVDIVYVLLDSIFPFRT